MNTSTIGDANPLLHRKNSTVESLNRRQELEDKDTTGGLIVNDYSKTKHEQRIDEWERRLTSDITFMSSLTEMVITGRFSLINLSWMDSNERRVKVAAATEQGLKLMLKEPLKMAEVLAQAIRYDLEDAYLVQFLDNYKEIYSIAERPYQPTDKEKSILISFGAEVNWKGLQIPKYVLYRDKVHCNLEQMSRWADTNRRKICRCENSEEHSLCRWKEKDSTYLMTSYYVFRGIYGFEKYWKVDGNLGYFKLTVLRAGFQHCFILDFRNVSRSEVDRTFEKIYRYVKIRTKMYLFHRKSYPEFSSKPDDELI